MSSQPLIQARNRRAAPRKAIHQNAKFAYGDATRTVQTWDLGRDGMCLLSTRPLAPGTRCTITFDLPVGAERIGVAAAAKIVYSSYSAAGEFKIGAFFIDLDEGTALALGKFADGACARARAARSVVATDTAQTVAENNSNPTVAQATRTMPPSHGWLNAAKAPAATSPDTTAQRRPRAVANSPSASE